MVYFQYSVSLCGSVPLFAILACSDMSDSSVRALVGTMDMAGTCNASGPVRALRCSQGIGRSNASHDRRTAYVLLTCIIAFAFSREVANLSKYVSKNLVFIMPTA